MKASAKIYTAPGAELRPSQREQIYEGLEIIGAEVGPIAVKGLQIGGSRLVDMRDTANLWSHLHGLDYLTDLHIFAAPFAETDGQYETLGLSFTGTGVSFVGTHGDIVDLRSTTAHEVAHSLGYKLRDSAGSLPTDQHHCSQLHCAMHPEIVRPSGGYDAHYDPTIVTVTARKQRLAPSAHEFCGECKDEMRGTIEEHADKLRRGRLYVKKVSERANTFRVPSN